MLFRSEVKSKVVLKKSVQNVTIENPDTDRIAKILVRGGQQYDFELSPGDNFYFIISQEVGGEHHVITSYE